MILLCLLLFEINNTFVSRNAFEYFSVLHKLLLTAENHISSFLKMKFVNTGNYCVQSKTGIIYILTCNLLFEVCNY